MGDSAKTAEVREVSRNERSPRYSTTRFSTNRRMVSANSALALKKHTIHLMTEVDVTDVRRLMAGYRERSGESLSLTAYIATCLARVLVEFPSFNSFRKGRRLYVFEDITVAVALEREVNGESIPQPVHIRGVNSKTFAEVNDEFREAQRAFGIQGASEQRESLVRFVPDALVRAFVRLATRDPGVLQHVGVVGVSSVGAFAPESATWLLPLSPATVMVSVGSIARRPAVVDGELQDREVLCLTLSFDHDIVDGAPAARFVKRFGEILSAGDEVRALTGQGSRGSQR